MKNFLVLLSAVTIIMGLVPAVPAFAGKTPAVKHEIIVSNDGDGDFTTVDEALNSITDATENNRYLITLKPGTYFIGSHSVSYVDLRGGGIENTTLFTSYFTYFIDTRISNMSIKNNGISAPISIYNSQGRIILDGVDIVSSYGIAIMIWNNSQELIPELTVKDSRIVLPEGPLNQSYGISGDVSTLELNNTLIKNTNIGITVHFTNQSRIRNSTIIAESTAISYHSPSSDLYIYNSVISAGTEAFSTTPSPGRLFVAGSQLKGIMNVPAGNYKLVNCHDEAFTPIPNH